MKALIFAAGIGSRLKPFTLSHPKALAPVAGKPALQWAIDKFSRHRVAAAVVNTHHFADQVKNYLSALPKCHMAIRISDESRQLLDTGGGLLKAAPLLEDSDGVWLHNADIITDVDLDGMEAAFNQSGADALLLVADRPSSRRLWFDRLTSRLQGWQNTATGQTQPQGFQPDPSTMYGAAFGGIHLIHLERLLALLREYAHENGDIFSMTPFYIWAAERADIRGYAQASPYRWFDIGTPEKLAACDQAFSDI